MNWSQGEVNSIKIELSEKRYRVVERLSNRIGVDEESIRKKIESIELMKRIQKLARGAE